MNEKRQILTAAQVRALLPVLAVLLLLLAAGLAWTGWQQTQDAKRIDFIAANQVGVEGSGFESDDNALAVIGHDSLRRLGPAPKTELAQALIELIAERLS